MITKSIPFDSHIAQNGTARPSCKSLAVKLNFLTISMLAGMRKNGVQFLYAY